jgi:hypothetical protein
MSIAVLQSTHHHETKLPAKHAVWWKYIWLIVLIMAIWLPRVLELDRFVTPDERRWLSRSANFYHALTHGDFAYTYQQSHPGVTILWAGTAGFLWRYPAYAREAPAQLAWGEDVGPFLRTHGHEPLELLKAGRLFVVLAITLVLVLSYFASIRLIGFWPSSLSFVLIAGDPFEIALSRLLHLDGLASSLMLLTLLAFLNYLYHGRRSLDLLVSAVAAGLSWLTKSPSIVLVPFVGLLLLLDSGLLSRLLCRVNGADIRRVLQPLLVWSIVGTIVFILLWPAVWVDPIHSFREIGRAIVGHSLGGHELPLYFNGAVIDGDPGWYFYPITYLWRTTPFVLVGLIFAAMALAIPRARLVRPAERRVIIVLILFAIFFCLCLSVGAKKFDRYLLPIYGPLTLVAAVGWLAAVRWLIGAPWAVVRRTARALPLLVIAGQFGSALAEFPYYFSYYNPLLGGATRAATVMMIGWGEGLDQVANYLNAMPNAQQLRVTLRLGDDTFSYVFKGQVQEGRFTADAAGILNWVSSDYSILYINEVQRRLYPPQLFDYLAHQTPVLVVRIHTLEYARVYDLRQAPLPEYLLQDDTHFIDWGSAVRLIAHDLSDGAIAPGQTHRVTLCFQRLAALDHDLAFLVRFIDSEGHELQRSEGKLSSHPERRDVWLVEHDFTIPGDALPQRYRMELSLYDTQTLAILAASNARTGEMFGKHIIVDSLVVGD